MSRLAATAVPARLGRAESQAATRASVLVAAEAAFVERGYDRAGIEEIAARAGFTKGAVYSNFGSKEELFLEVSNERDARLSAPLLEGLAAATDIEDCMTALDSWYRTTVDDDRAWALATAEFTLTALRKPDLHERLKAQHREARGAIAWLLAERTAAVGHVLPTDPEALAEVVMALGNGLAISHAIDEEIEPGLFLPAFRALLGLPPT
jgi:AcrR family transcriptional regulator